MEGVPLSPEDRAILDLECATIAGHTCKVIVAGAGAPSASDLRLSIDARLDATPLLRCRLGGTPDAPAWESDSDFDIARHVVDVPVDGPADATGLRDAVARLFEHRLDRHHPLWRIDRVPLTGGGAALVWRIHHALADGTAAMRFARLLLWDATGGTTTAPSPRAALHQDGDAHDDHRRRAHLAGFIHREFGRSLHASPFEGAIGGRRSVAFANIALAPLRDAARRLEGATVNDAVLTIVAGAIRRWLLEHHGGLRGVRVRVPVSLHHEGDAASNHDSFFTFALPLDEPDPIARLHAVHAATSARKSGHDAELFDQLHTLAARVPSLRRLMGRLEESPRKFAVSVSNVPGPREAVTMRGVPVTGLYTLAEIGRAHALRIAVISLADTLSFGFCADPHLVENVEQMAAAVEAEAAALGTV